MALTRIFISFAMVVACLPVASAFRGQGRLHAALNTALNQSGPELGLGIAAVSKYAGGNCQFMPAFDVAAFLVGEAPAAAKGVGMLAKPAVTAVQVATKVAGASVPGAAGAMHLVTQGAKAVDVVARGAKAVEAVTKGAKVVDVVAKGAKAVDAVTKGAQAVDVVAKGAKAAGVVGAVAKGTKTLTLASKAGLIGKVVGGALSLSNPIGVAWTAYTVGTSVYSLYELQKVLRDPHQLCDVLSDWVPPYDQSGCLKNLKHFTPPKPNLPLPAPPSQLAAAKLDKKVVVAAAAVLMVSTGPSAKHFMQWKLQHACLVLSVCSSQPLLHAEKSWM